MNDDLHAFVEQNEDVIKAAIARGLFDSVVEDRHRCILAYEQSARYADGDAEYACDRNACGHDSAQHEDFGECQAVTDGGSA